MKIGPLTREEILGIWRSAVDDSYSDPIIAAGYGNGFEAIDQMPAQFARISEAADRSTQWMFMKPWSGQSNEPAGGERRATVLLTFTRTARLEQPLVLAAGLIKVGERQIDWGRDGGIPIETGRLYELATTGVLNPGDTTITIPAIAVRPGYGYNNPLPHTIVSIQQVGTQLTNDHADVIAYNIPAAENPPQTNGALVDSDNQPDVFVPQHVGQYLWFIEGDNTGQIGWITSYSGPDLSNPINPSGGKVTLADLRSFTSTIPATFQVGERVAILDGGPTPKGYAIILSQVVVDGEFRSTLLMQSGEFDVGDIVAGIISVAMVVAEVMTYRPESIPGTAGYVSETNTAAWEILDWVNDWGLTCDNIESPKFGRLAMLDALGDERNINRAPGESDDSYRARVTQLADVVSPNAIHRTVNRILVPLGIFFTDPGETRNTHHLYEVGTPDFPGFFFDAGASTDADPSIANNYPWDIFATMTVPGGIQTGVFFEGEPVWQPSTNARGFALVNIPPVLSPPGPALPAVLDSVNVYQQFLSPYFGPGDELIGLKSGATYQAVGWAFPSNFKPNRRKYWLSYGEMRAFFLVEIPPRQDGEFGLAYDDLDSPPHPLFNPYDVSDRAYDGYPTAISTVWKTLYQAIATNKAAGVSFDLIQAPPFFFAP